MSDGQLEGRGTELSGGELSPWTDRLFAALALVLPAILYFVTLAPTIYPGDSAELIASAFCLGVPHPTGYPLFMILGHFVQKLGLGSPAFSMNLMCAFFGALACLSAYFLQREIWRIVRPDWSGRVVCRVVCLAAALLLGAGSTWWSQATMTEVYSLMLVFITAVWAVGLRLLRAPGKRGLWVLALLSGLGFLHHMLFLVTLPLSVLAAWRCLRGAKAGVWVPALVLFCLPLLGYAYLPIRGEAMPQVNMGDTRGFDGMLGHMAGGEFRETRVLSHPNGVKFSDEEIPGHLALRGKDVLRWLGEQVVAPPAGESGQRIEASGPESARAPMLALVLGVLAVVGGTLLWRRGKFAAMGLLGGLVLNIVVVMVYTIADIEAYQMPLWIIIVSLAALGPIAAGEILMPDGEVEAEQAAKERKRIIGTAIALFVLCGTAIGGWWSPGLGVNKAGHEGAYLYADKLMKMLPQDAVVFTTGDFDIFPLWYAQVCEGKRPDVAVVGANFIFSRWYAAMLKRNLPDGVEVFVGDVGGRPDSNVWLHGLLGGCVAPQLTAGRPVYLTAFAGRTPMGTSEWELIEQFGHYKLQTAGEFRAVSAFGNDISLTLFEITDPDGFAPRWWDKFRSEDFFPSYPVWMVRRESQ